MARGILYVASRPVSPEREEEYNTWYNEVHMPEICELPGVLSARRFAPVTDGGPYVALYEIEGDDLRAVAKGMMKAMGEGRITMSDAIQLDPAPEMRILEHIASHE